MMTIALCMFLLAAGDDEPWTGLEGMRDVKATIEKMAAAAREKRDLILLNCVHDKLKVVEGMLKLAESTRVEMRSEDPDEVAHARAKIGIIMQKVGLMLAEAKECPRELATYPETPRTEIQVERDAAVPKDDPLPKGYILVYRVRFVEATDGKVRLGIGLHHLLDVSDRLVSILLALDGEKVFDQVEATGGLACGCGRLLVEKPVEPGKHTVSVQLKIDGRRPGGGIRPTAASSMNVDVPAGKSALVEIISTLEGKPEPGNLKLSR